MTTLRYGKTRVIGVDLFDHEDYIVGDYNEKNEALEVARNKNHARRGSMDDIYYVYNDKGEYLHPDLGTTKVSP